MTAISLVLAAAIAAIALPASSQVASAQDDLSCAPTILGQISGQSAVGLQADGRWSTQDCESQHRPGSDAQYFEFEIMSAGRVRIELTSDSADSYLYLLTADGAQIADDDDSGLLLNARIERELSPGTYRVEATTVGGRTRGAAEFSLKIGFVDGCDIAPLGALTPGSNLIASGSLGHETCGSRIVVAHPARNYLFQLPAPGRVRIDLTSPNGDPVLSMATVEGAVIGANDDGGTGRNSRIEQYLPAGAYIIEATTYRRGGLQPLAADFELTVGLIDELQRQQLADPKVEALVVPEQVTAGEPFLVHYRVGNLGGGDLHEISSRIQIQGYGTGFQRQWFNNIAVTDSSWTAGTSYHTGEVVASAASTTLDGVEAQEMTLDQAGRSWVLIALFVLDENGRGTGFHSIWKHIDVVGGATFAPVRVRIDDKSYEVEATADAEGEVTTTVTDLADRDAAVGSLQRNQAIYAAGVRNILLDDIFDRPAIARMEDLRSGLFSNLAASAIGGSGPTSNSVRAAFAADYLATIDGSGLGESNGAGLMIDPARVEDLVLAGAQSASQRFASLSASWRSLQARMRTGGAIAYSEALALHSQLRYAESALAPLIEGGELVSAARADDDGWSGAVAGRLSEFARQAVCARSNRQLTDALTLIEGNAADEVLALDAELRLASPVFGTVADSILCAAAEADDANDRLFELLGIDRFASVLLPGYRFIRGDVVSEPEPHALRILARRHADGRIEHAVELASGRIIRPERRFLGAEIQIGRQHSSSPVEIFGQPIGTIRSQRNSQNQVLLSFLGSDGVQVTPQIRILPAEATVGVWLRTSQIEVPPAVPQLASVG